jgi:autotransporter-associated beta strand protein
MEGDHMNAAGHKRRAVCVAALIAVAAPGCTTKTPVRNTGAGLNKAGAGTLSLTGANAYAGKTTITQGTLSLAGPGCLSTASDIDLKPGGTLNLNFAGTQTIHTLYFDGAPLAAGTYSSNSLRQVTGSGYLKTLAPLKHPGASPPR